MQSSAYYKEYSPSLGREMEFEVYGHGGKPCIVFPCQNGRFFDFNNFKMTDVASPWIGAGQLQLFCVDSVDAQTWSDVGGDPRHRSEMLERWYHYIADELVPRIRQINATPEREKLMVTGCSMGATHAGIFALRRPDLFDVAICMSGLYHAGYFFGDYMDQGVYDNSPVDFTANMPPDHPYIQMYNNNRMVFCTGQGAWEDEMVESTRRLEAVFRQKGIHAWVDFWGYDVNHDWPLWLKQFPYFLEKLL